MCVRICVYMCKSSYVQVHNASILTILAMKWLCIYVCVFIYVSMYCDLYRNQCKHFIMLSTGIQVYIRWQLRHKSC